MSSTLTAKSKTKKLALSAASALLLVGAGCAPEASTNVTANVNVTPTPSDDTSHVMPDGTVMEGDSHYKDGTYEVTGKYTSPAGPETITVNVTLKDDVVTDATVTPHATNQISVKMQGQFVEGYKAQVVGKNIAEVNVGKVSGSSLTPKGFNDAIAQIKVEAAK